MKVLLKRRMEYLTSRSLIQVITPSGEASIVVFIFEEFILKSKKMISKLGSRILHICIHSMNKVKYQIDAITQQVVFSP